MMRPSYNPGYTNPVYPHSMPNYWEGYPQDMSYYHQPMQPYPFQMMGDSVMQKQGGQNLYHPQSFPQQFPQQPMTIGAFPEAMMQQQQPSYYSPPQSAQPFNPFDNPLQPKVKRP